MLKKHVAETDVKVKDRRMLIIKIKRDGTNIREAALACTCASGMEFD